MKVYLTCLLVLVSLLGCKQKNSTQEVAKNKTFTTYTEPYRPQYHFSPKANWMNDPNGLVFYDDTYHLFYQYYPDDTKWGPMHWGHATSRDLKSWQHKPVALYPDSLGYIFSGSAIVDSLNTSGLGTSQNPPLVAMFTYHEPKGEKEGKTNYQTQGIAYSLDKGTTWTKYKGNPTLPNTQNLKDFRDPKIFWHSETNKWILLVVAGDHAKIYNSDNLIDWVYLSDFGKNTGAHGGVWECPDLFKLPVQDKKESKWVLLISINPGAPNGGSGTQYFIGDFDGVKFTTNQKIDKWLDYGRDNYAGITYNNLPQNERIFIGWMSNWNYGQETPTSPWRSSMTLPRKLNLYKNPDYFLANTPVKAITKDLNFRTKKLINSTLTDSLLQQSVIQFELPKPLQDFELVFSNPNGEHVNITYSKSKKSFYLDRKKSGVKDFSEDFAASIMQAPAQFTNSTAAEFSIFLDQSSIEFFADQGATVLTAQIFPQSPYTNLQINTHNTVQIDNLKIAHIPSIWNNKK